MTPLLKKVIIMDQNLHSRTAIWPVSRLSTESIGSRRELVANCVHTADATQLDSCVTSSSAVCIGLHFSYSFRLTTIGRRSFPVAASIVWNSLPVYLQSSPYLFTFRQRLKINLFQLSFPDIVIWHLCTALLWTSYWLYAILATLKTLIGWLIDRLIVGTSDSQSRGCEFNSQHCRISCNR